MKLIFVRHGDPDYKNDTLTEKGKREAALLAERICHWDVTDFYCSPLGRAQATAKYTLDKMNRTALTLDWTREFSYPIDDPVTGRKGGIPWDLVPSSWCDDVFMLSRDGWPESDIMSQNPEIAIHYNEVCTSLDALLKTYGYERDGNFYRVPGKKEVFISSTTSPDNLAHLNSPDYSPNEPTVVIFCHLGVICIMLSHLLNIPFPLLVHGFFLPTTSLTILNTEERWGNEAYFRTQAMGDVHHLLTAGEPVSNAGYFAKVFQG
jgi:probable phosphoglycerate mutase